MPVSRPQLERGLQRVRAHVQDPAAGLHGPGSVSWRLNREAVIFLGGGRAALLQLAHPAVAYAVDHHSETRRDPVGRFNRTFRNVFAMVFGDLDSALRSARRVHNIHRRVRGEIGENVGTFRKGDPYEANDAEALMWVNATLIETAVLVYERVVGPLSHEEKQRYYEESKSFGWLFGLDERVMPPDWDAFVRYCEGMYASDVLAVSTPAAEIAHYLLSSPNRMARPIAQWYRAVTAGLLPASVRAQYGLRYGQRERLLLDTSLRAIGATYPLLPRRLRYVPAYVEARRRLAGQQATDRFGRVIEQLVLQTLRPK